VIGEAVCIRISGIAYCTVAWSPHYKNSWLKSAKSLRCYLNLKAQSIKKHWNELTCVPGYELTCLLGTSWLGWVRVDWVWVDLTTTWPDNIAGHVGREIISNILGTKTYPVCSMTRSKVKVKVTSPWKWEILPFLTTVSSPINNGGWQMTMDS